MNSKPTPLPETADIETSSDAYAARFASPVGQWMLSVQEQIVRRLLADKPGATILDVGGGHGQLAVPLAEAGYKVTVLGSDDSCRKRVQPVLDKGLAQFVAGNVIALPFRDRSFDVAMSFRLLPHCDSWRRLIKELCRVAGERVIVDYPTTQSLNTISPLLFAAKKRVETNTRPYTLFPHREVQDQFTRYGFRLQARVGEFFLPMVLHRMMNAPGLSRACEAFFGALRLTRLWGSPVILDMRRA